MANYDCGSCEDLRTSAPHFVANGFTSYECNSLKNNTGLNPSSGHDDCTDLNDMADCLVGNMEQELPAYDTCDWKPFMKKFIPNVWSTLKGIICAICGLWGQFDEIWCWLDHLSKPQKNDTLYPDDPKVKFRKVDGVTLRYDPDHPRPNDAPLQIKVIGSTARITGSITCKGNMPSSYTNGQNVDWLDIKRGGTNITNTYGKHSNDGNFPSGGALLYEYEVKACDWGFKTLYNAPLMPGEAGLYIARILTYKDGDEYPYDCGWDANGNGQIYHPSSSKFDTLIQIRMETVNTWGITEDYGNITPNGVAMVYPCTESWDC